MVGKSFTKLVLSLLVIFVLVGCASTTTDTNSTENGVEKFKIGITQIVQHEALDKNREGFIAALESRGFKEGVNITIDYQNAAGDLTTANLAAQTFVSNDVDLIFAIATPTAQAAKNATDGTNIPVLFSAVTDPVSAGLVDSNEQPGGNVSGTSDMTPIAKQFDILKELLPNKTRVGIVFNSNEQNSLIQVNLAKTLASQKGLTIKERGVTDATDLANALDVLLNEVDVLYIPTDNLVASNMPLVIEKTLEKNIPVIGSEEAHVNAGALVTEGIDYYNLGFQTGLLAADILEGKIQPSQIEVKTLLETKLVINQTTATLLGITIPEGLKSRAQIVESGE